MTEKEAWEFLAEMFEEDFHNGYNVYGLCNAVATLHYNDQIFIEVLYSMEGKIKNDLGSSYWFDFDPNGNYSPTSQKLRANKALEYSKLCTSG